MQRALSLRRCAFLYFGDRRFFEVFRILIQLSPKPAYIQTSNLDVGLATGMFWRKPKHIQRKAHIFTSWVQ